MYLKILIIKGFVKLGVHRDDRYGQYVMHHALTHEALYLAHSALYAVTMWYRTVELLLVVGAVGPLQIVNGDALGWLWSNNLFDLLWGRPHWAVRFRTCVLICCVFVVYMQNVHSSAVSFHPSSWSIDCRAGVATLFFSQLITRDSIFVFVAALLTVIYLDLRFKNSFFWPRFSSPSSSLSSSTSSFNSSFYFVTGRVFTSFITWVLTTGYLTTGGSLTLSSLFSFYFLDSSTAFLGSYFVLFFRFSASWGSFFLVFVFFFCSSGIYSWNSWVSCFLLFPMGISSQLG